MYKTVSTFFFFFMFYECIINNGLRKELTFMANIKDVAKQAGIWRNYFIHFDDVEWCLRIGKMGYRVVVSAKSLIWHLSAAAKVPTWVLYYDNRNILDLLQTHGANKQQLKQLTKYILKKAIYYHLIGKSDLAQLHYDAINDF